MSPYTPEPLPPENIDCGPLVGLVGRANAELARYDGLLQGIVNSQYAIHALDAIFDRPIFLSTDFVERSGIPTRATALGLLRQMQTAGILNVLQKGSGRRPARLCFPGLINLAEGREVV